ncbi:hypothetical protein K239x_39610 [Planctomycetes bacterium K23_9]|uniref:Uncharacterized protein n=1 Tax=Stieleria marina TaxID=1930275 RepID=A0A517NXY8_9BACT|nr:hypothetical protein K239x_39610 [Planctomycetes bacterium K23_9]
MQPSRVFGSGLQGEPPSSELKSTMVVPIKPASLATITWSVLNTGHARRGEWWPKTPVANN